MHAQPYAARPGGTRSIHNVHRNQISASVGSCTLQHLTIFGLICQLLTQASAQHAIQSVALAYTYRACEMDATTGSVDSSPLAIAPGLQSMAAACDGFAEPFLLSSLLQALSP